MSFTEVDNADPSEMEMLADMISTEITCTVPIIMSYTSVYTAIHDSLFINGTNPLTFLLISDFCPTALFAVTYNVRIFIIILIIKNGKELALFILLFIPQRKFQEI